LHRDAEIYDTDVAVKTNNVMTLTGSVSSFADCELGASAGVLQQACQVEASMEHRWGERFSANVAVRLHLGSGIVVKGRLADVSVSGAFVVTETQVPVLSRVFVELGIASSEPGAQLVPAYVMREAPNGIGLEWVELSPSAIRAAPLAMRPRDPDWLPGPTRATH
jgi:PilZ domain